MPRTTDCMPLAPAKIFCSRMTRSLASTPALRNILVLPGTYSLSERPSSPSVFAAAAFSPSTSELGRLSGLTSAAKRPRISVCGTRSG